MGAILALAYPTVMQNGESSHVLRIFDDEARAMQSARNSHMVPEESYYTGVPILSKYSQQRDHLKNAPRKALDILNTVGLSNLVLKLSLRGGTELTTGSRILV